MEGIIIMRNFKKIICLLSICAIFMPTLTLAASNTTTLNGSDIKLFSNEDNENPTIEITLKDQELAESLSESVKNREETIQLDSQNAITGKRFEELWSVYFNPYLSEYFYLSGIEAHTEGENVASITMTYADELTEKEIELIEDIIDALSKRQQEISFDLSEYIDIEYVDALWERFNYIYNHCLGTATQFEHSDLFYVDFTKLGASGSGTTISFNIDNAYMPEDKIIEVNTTLDEEYNNITSLIKEGMSDMEKILIVHDYIAANYEYDLSEASRTLDSMVLERKGVCQGYSYLFKYIMDRLEFDCVNVPSNACGHMWNKVKIGEDWYNIDVTSDDAVPNMASNIFHKYFLVNDAEIQALDQNSDTALHSRWNTLKWDGIRDVETSISDTYSNLILHNITGQVVNYNEQWYGFVNAKDKDKDDDKDDDKNKNNVLSIIDFSTGTTTAVYKDSSKYQWFANENSVYSGVVSSIILYKNNLYFNSPNEVFKFNADDKTAEKIYEYINTENPGDLENPDDTENLDKRKPSIYGLTVKDGSLLAELSKSPESFVENYLPITTEEPSLINSYSSEITKNDDGTLKISLTSNSDYTPEITDVIYVAEYKDGILVNIVAKPLADNISQPFDYALGEDDSTNVGVFVWNSSTLPLSDAQSITLSDDNI